MHAPRPLIVLLILASALADFCIWLAKPVDFGPEIVLMMFVALLVSQANLLAVWVAIGRSKLLVRLAVAGMGTALLYFATLRRSNIHIEEDHEVVLLFAVQVAVVIVAILAMRFAGYRLRTTSDVEVVPGGEASAPLQFSIFNILQLTTAAAVAAAIGVHLAIRKGVAWETTFLAAAFAAPVPVIAWAALCPTGHKWRISIAVSLGIIGGILIFYYWPYKGEPMTALCCGQYLLVGASLFVVRLAGYRFVRGTATLESD